MPATIVLLLLTGGCARATGTTPGRHPPNMLDPRGPAAENIAQLWWIIFGLGTAVFVLVTAILFYTTYVRWTDGHSADVDVDLRDISGAPWILWGGIVMPFIILMITFYFGLDSLRTVFRPPQPPTVTIEVIGHRWWWEVRYPEQGIVTANELVIPVGQPVELVLTSVDVIHSFWVPQLHGKQDMTPGRTDTLWIQADEAGVYRGICAEFCGLQHAKMHFLVIAEEPAVFDAWLTQQQQPAPEPGDEMAFRGQQVFMSSACVYCHTIEGTPATGRLGPDLTHLASRQTLAAGIIENNRGNLGGWIIDPQNIKPGNLMPPTNFSSEDLQALLIYLETLE